MKVLDFGLAKAMDPGAAEATPYAAANSTSTCGRCRCSAIVFFHSLDDHIMAVDVRSGPVPAPSVPRALFPLPADVNNGRFVVTPDGQRFLVPLEVQRPKPGEVMIMLNWLEALKSSQKAGK